MILTQIETIQIDENIKWQLSYDQMRLLADAFEEWAFAPEIASAQKEKLLTWSEGMIQLSYKVGRQWLPPESECISLIGFIARELEMG